MSEVLLSAKNLTKRFGGLAAVNDVSIDLWRNHIHAVIGPNGAGKSTLTNLLSGDLPPTSGSVTLGGHDVTGWTPEKISNKGLGRSYQKTNIFLPFSVWENVRLASQSRAPNAARWLQQHLRLGGQGHGDLELALLAVADGAGDGVHAILQAG